MNDSLQVLVEAGDAARQLTAPARAWALWLACAGAIILCALLLKAIS